MRAREGKLAGKLGVTGAAVALQRGKIWQAGPTGQRMGARERAEASVPRLGLTGNGLGRGRASAVKRGRVLGEQARAGNGPRELGPSGGKLAGPPGKRDWAEC